MEEIIISQKSGVVNCDFEKAKAQLDAQLALYRNMVFTEDTKKDAKNTVAELRKEKKAFAERCKEVKREYMKPLDDFMAKASELSDMFDTPINFINEQIDAFEKQRIEEKKALIEEIYLELVSEEDIQAIIPLSAIYNSKWENATVNAKAIREEIMTAKIECKRAIETIKAMHSEVEEIAIEKYKADRDLSACVLYLSNYECQKREILEREQERIRREEEERIRREERAKIEAEQRHEEELRMVAEAVREETKAEVIDSFIPEPTTEEEKPYTYTIFLSDSAKEVLENYMNSIGVEFLCTQ